MASLPVEVVLGIYLGLLTGIIPALVSWGIAFLFKYFTGVTMPAVGVIALSLAIAGANGGILALNDPTVRGAPNSITLVTAILVVMMASLYAHSRGDKMGAEFPKRLSLRRLREQTLSADVVELVGGHGRVRVTITGEVDDIEGYPPLSADLRGEIKEKEYTFPADLPLAELEARMVDKLRTEFELADVTARIDGQGRATVAAAPPAGGVSKRVLAGKRAVSVGSLVPTGLTRGDEVRLFIGGEPIDGTVLSARSNLPAGGKSLDADGGEEPPDAPPTSTPTTEGGDGRLTVAVSREAARRLLRVDRAHVVVRARGTRREFELISLLRRAGKRFRRLTVGTGSQVDATTIGGAAVRERYGVVILAIRDEEGWTLAPRGATPVGAGDELFVVGTGESITRFAEAAT